MQIVQLQLNLHVIYIKVEAMKICSRCKTGKSTTEFSKLYNGLQSWCRDCSKNYRIHRKLKNPTPKTHLYIMSYSGGQPNVYKVGQSCNIEHRVHTLESSHIFHMTVHAIYPFQGFLESYVHDSLNPYRIKGFTSREWFACSLDLILQAISSAIASDAQINGRRSIPRSIDSYFGRPAAEPTGGEGP